MSKSDLFVPDFLLRTSILMNETCVLKLVPIHYRLVLCRIILPVSDVGV